MYISETMRAAICAQINRELASEYLYQAMANWASLNNWPGVETWLRVASREERDHGLTFVAYLNDQNAAVDLRPIEAPATSYSDVRQIFNLVLAQEQAVTKFVRDLSVLAFNERDLSTLTLLDWFVKEQVDSEKEVEQLIAQISRLDDSGLQLFDEDLGDREYATNELALSYGVL